MEKYKRLRILGTGSFSKVFLVQDGETGVHLVVKQIEATLSGPERERALQEVALLRVLQHPHIVSYREAFVTRSGHICLIMEYAEGGDLHQFLQAQRLQAGYLLEAQVLKWFSELCEAMQFLHGLNVLHRDIKAHNIFLRSSGIVQLGDFGISTVADSQNGSVVSSVGTPNYASPERVRRQAYGASADIWSLGIVIYELCALRRPFEAEDLSSLAERILSGEYAPLDDRSFSGDLRCVVTRMLAHEPAVRPTAADLLELPLLRFLEGNERKGTRQSERSFELHQMETVILPETDVKQPHGGYPSGGASRPTDSWPAGPSHNSWVPADCSTRRSPRGHGDVVEALVEDLHPVLGPDGEEPSPRSPKNTWSSHDRHPHHIGHALLHGARRLLGFGPTGL